MGLSEPPPGISIGRAMFMNAKIPEGFGPWISDPVCNKPCRSGPGARMDSSVTVSQRSVTISVLLAQAGSEACGEIIEEHGNLPK